MSFRLQISTHQRQSQQQTQTSCSPRSSAWSPRAEKLEFFFLMNRFYEQTSAAPKPETPPTVWMSSLVWVHYKLSKLFLIFKMQETAATHVNARLRTRVHVGGDSWDPHGGFRGVNSWNKVPPQWDQLHWLIRNSHSWSWVHSSSGHTAEPKRTLVCSPKIHKNCFD